jgi:UDP-2-acetamido-3-amino-2,3-dideoxy-glucuronate N-acetyltransferase
MNKPYFVHESSYVDEPVSIGKGTKIWHFSHIMKGATIGEACKIGQNVVIGSTAILGNNVKVQNNVSIYDAVILEDHVFCGPSIAFTNVFNPRCEVSRNTMDDYRKTVVKRGASIGANSTIVCGNTIGRYAFIGAGSVVTKDIPDYALVMGNPAKIKGWMCQCGEKLSFNEKSEDITEKATCEACSKKYEKTDFSVTFIE